MSYLYSEMLWIVTKQFWVLLCLIKGLFFIRYHLSALLIFTVIAYFTISQHWRSVIILKASEVIKTKNTKNLRNQNKDPEKWNGNIQNNQNPRFSAGETHFLLKNTCPLEQTSTMYTTIRIKKLCLIFTFISIKIPSEEKI